MNDKERQLIYLAPEDRRKTKSKAASMGKSISDFIQDALYHYFKFLDKEKAGS